MPERTRDFYREANKGEGGACPVDDAGNRRLLQHGRLAKKIISAQRRLFAALDGEHHHLYFRLEELVGQRQCERDEVMFNLGFEHGLMRGRADAPTAGSRVQCARGRGFAEQLVQLVVNAGIEPRHVVSALLQVAWALALERDDPRFALSPGLWGHLGHPVPLFEYPLLSVRIGVQILRAGGRREGCQATAMMWCRSLVDGGGPE